MTLPAALVLLLASIASTAAGERIAAGKGVFAVCEACHGLQGEGNQALSAPRIAGIEPWYFARQIENFRAGQRGTLPGDDPGRQMRAMAATLDGEERIANVLAYVATLTPPRAAPTVKGDATRGQRVFELCVACHGPEGRGNLTIGAPALAGRDDWYLLRQLQNFREGRRGVASSDAFGAQMRAIALSLPDESALSDVIVFINTLQ